MKKSYKPAIVVLAFFFILLITFHFSTFHPDEVENEPFICSDTLPELEKRREYKILSWNVQYMAGKNYLFFYDEWDESGPDSRPSAGDIAFTFNRVAEIIKSESPDIILLQELDCGAKRTDKQDQLAELLKLLPSGYAAYTSSYYWKAAFVPHPMIMGSVGIKLAVIARYKISDSVRYQLPLMPNNYIIKNLQFKRAVLAAEFPVKNSSPVSLMSTHLDAFAQGSDTMQRQVRYVANLLEKMNNEKKSWIIGGDFNLIPPGESYNRLPESDKPYFQKETEMKVLYDRFSVLPSIKNIDTAPEKYFTHFPNYASGPDRTIDYLIHSDRIIVKNFHVRSFDTTDISDHLPVIMTFEIK